MTCIVGSCMTCILRTARISNVESVMNGDKKRMMVNFKHWIVIYLVDSAIHLLNNHGKIVTAGMGKDVCCP